MSESASGMVTVSAAIVSVGKLEYSRSSMSESTSRTITVTLYSLRLDGYIYYGYTCYGYTCYGCTHSACTYHISTYQVRDVPPLALQALLHFLYTDDFAQVRWLPPRIWHAPGYCTLHAHACHHHLLRR